jgi:lipopolysaccharide export system permease protein
MDRIDRYVLRQFVMTFFFAILAFITIYLAVDLMEKLDDFFDRNVETPIILKYYLYKIPDIIHLVVPIAMLLASLFTIGRLDTTHELTAIRAAGRSVRRFVLPLLCFGLLVSLGMIYFDGYVVPISNKEHFAIDRQYLGRNVVTGQSNVFLRISPTLNLHMDYFDAKTGIANKVSLERIDTSAPILLVDLKGRSGTTINSRTDTARTIKITQRIDAESMHYDSTRKIWTLVGGVARNFDDPVTVQTTFFTEREIPGIPVTPDELNLSQQNINELTLEEMRGRIDQEQLGGREINRLLVDYYARISFPFSALIVIFFGIPFSSNQRKSGAAVTIAITALISAVYLVMTEISKTFSYGGSLDPIVIAWMANGAFLFVGLLNLIRVERG